MRDTEQGSRVSDSGARDSGAPACPTGRGTQFKRTLAGLSYQEQVDLLRPSPIATGNSGAVQTSPETTHDGSTCIAPAPAQTSDQPEPTNQPVQLCEVGTPPIQSTENPGASSPIQLTEDAAAPGPPADDGAGLETEVSELASRVRSTIENVRDIWYELHESIRSSQSTDVVYPGRDRIQQIVEQIESRFSEIEEATADTPLESELNVNRQVWNRGIVAGVNLQTYAGARVSGSIRLTSLLGDSTRDHVHQMAAQLRRSAHAYSSALTLPTLSRKKAQVERLDGARLLFAQELLMDTPCTDIQNLSWCSGSRSAWQRLFTDGDAQRLTSDARSVAEAEDNGVAPNEMEAIQELAQLANDLLQPNRAPAPARYEPFRTLLQRPEERVAFIRLLNSRSIYDQFMTRAPDELATWLRAGTGFAEPVRVEVGYAAVGQAAEVYGEEFIMQSLLLALEAVGISEDEFNSLIGGVRETITIIIDDPIGFIGNLFEAVGGGFNLFVDNFWDHLQTGLLDWLTGQVGSAGIDMPAELNLAGVFDIVRQVLGLTNDDLENLIGDRIGAENVERIQQVWGFVEVLIQDGWGGLWEYAQEFLSDLWDQVIGEIQRYLVEEVVEAAISQLLRLLIGGAAASLEAAVRAAWNIYQTLRDNIDRIRAVIENIVSNMYAIATGDLSNAIAMVDNALGNALSIAIEMLANYLGLGGIGDKVGEIINSIQATVHNAINSMIDRIIEFVRGLFGGGDEASEEGEDDNEVSFRSYTFSINDEEGNPEEHRIFFDTAGSRPRMMVQSNPEPVVEALDSGGEIDDAVPERVEDQVDQRALSGEEAAANATQSGDQGAIESANQAAQEAAALMEQAATPPPIPLAAQLHYDRGAHNESVARFASVMEQYAAVRERSDNEQQQMERAVLTFMTRMREANGGDLTADRALECQPSDRTRIETLNGMDFGEFYRLLSVGRMRDNANITQVLDELQELVAFSGIALSIWEDTAEAEDAFEEGDAEAEQEADSSATELVRQGEGEVEQAQRSFGSAVRDFIFSPNRFFRALATWATPSGWMRLLTGALTTTVRSVLLREAQRDENDPMWLADLENRELTVEQLEGQGVGETLRLIGLIISAAGGNVVGGFVTGWGRLLVELQRQDEDNISVADYLEALTHAVGEGIVVGVPIVGQACSASELATRLGPNAVNVFNVLRGSGLVNAAVRAWRRLTGREARALGLLETDEQEVREQGISPERVGQLMELVRQGRQLRDN